MIRPVIPLAMLAAMAMASPGHGQAVQPAACAAMDAGLPKALAGWTRRTPLAPAKTDFGATNTVLALGKAVTAQLKPGKDVDFPVKPGGDGTPDSYGGLFQIQIRDAGDYQVSLGSGVWVDLVDRRTALESKAHGHGGECSTLRKYVIFHLSPGAYVVQVAAAGDPTVALMVSRAPEK